MTELRYINLGSVDSNHFYTSWEYSRIYDITTPTLFAVMPNKTLVDVHYKNKLEDYLNLDEISEDVDIIRSFDKTTNNLDTTIVWDPATVWYTLHIKLTGDNIERQKSNIERKFSSATIKVLRERGLKCFCDLRGNDLLFISNGKTRKFGCFLWLDWGNNNYMFGMMVSFRINTDLMNKVFKFDNDKYNNKIDFTGDMNDLLGSILDEKPDLDIENVIKDVAYEFSKGVNLNIIDDTLNDSEVKRLNKLAEGLKSEDWSLRGIHPEVKN